MVGIVALLLLLVSSLVEVRIIVERPGYGDVTGAVRTLWQLALGVPTVGSLLIAIYNASRDEPDSESPASGLEIRGRYHDIDIHLYPDTRSDSEEGSDDAPGERETEDPDDNGDSISERAGE